MSLERRIALKTLGEIESKGRRAKDALNLAFKEHPRLSQREREMVTELTYGILRQRLHLDWILSSFLTRGSLSRFSPFLRNLLRLGAYQLLNLNSVPDYAAVSEAVRIARETGLGDKTGLVNAVLRNISRKKGNIYYPDADKNPAGYISVKYSHPEWMVSRWIKRWKREETEELCRVNNLPPPFTIRVNTLRTDRKKLREILLEEGVETEECCFSPVGLRLKGGQSSVLKMHSFGQGFFMVQDESSQLIPYILSPMPGERVLDACAAPGGKASHMAQLMENQGLIVAQDRTLQKLEVVTENCSRMGVTIVETTLGDACCQEGRNLFDRILVDAPCSGLGTIRRRVDLRWRRNVEDVMEVMPELQFAILDNIAASLKPGGVLVYSVCSFEPEEGAGVIERFLHCHQEFYLDSVRPYLPPGGDELVEQGFLITCPHKNDMDGFFAARLVKKVK